MSDPSLQFAEAVNSEPTAEPAAEPTADAPESKAAGKSPFLSVFLSTFATILLAEMGDKTQLTTLLMTAESQKPFVVFLGAGLALVSTSLIGVSIGRWLASRVSEEAIETAAGIALLAIAVFLVGDLLEI